MKTCALWFLLVTLLNAVAFTQDKDVLPNNFLSGMHVIASHPAPGGPYAAQKRATNVLRPLPNATSSSSFLHQAWIR